MLRTYTLIQSSGVSERSVSLIAPFKSHARMCRLKWLSTVDVFYDPVLFAAPVAFEASSFNHILRSRHHHQTRSVLAHN